MNGPECTDPTQCKEYYCDCKKGWSGEKCEISTLFGKYYLGNKDEGIYQNFSMKWYFVTKTVLNYCQKKLFQ